ncbi:hypothetical protein [Coraliomargarita parva]|uniref:hypothetical protein n=1 Tax=Coraliomargarita parva TaxID=3014050 RepID=UPI0022B5DBA0|nr:hypothetical protein [Coraliomargarita parva]
MKGILQEVDMHIIVLGIIVSLVLPALFLAIPAFPKEENSTIFIATSFGVMLLLLEPSILTRTIERKKNHLGHANYFIVNTFIALLFGVATSLAALSLFPET